ncbi:hypothetical protein [Halomonas halocynthiae]|uniref:hypothetical protein n=1 Tax=Halomonas halocynthiae TaxID=176290 RepID=UPI000419DDBD|nr:hypothetical protein [Halomonas halocynthiae]
MHSPQMRLLVIATLITLGLALWYLLRYALDADTDVRWVPPTGTCDISQGPCSTPLGDGKQLIFSMQSDGPIHALTLLPLVVELEGGSATAAVVRFEGLDMDMGLHRFPLTAMGDIFQGEGQIALCTEDIMDWRARVIVDTPDGRVGSWFDFQVVKN